MAAMAMQGCIQRVYTLGILPPPLPPPPPRDINRLNYTTNIFIYQPYQPSVIWSTHKLATIATLLNYTVKVV